MKKMMMLVLILIQVGLVFAEPGEHGTAWLVPSSQSLLTETQVEGEIWANTAEDSSMAGINLYSNPALTYVSWGPGSGSIDLGYTDTSVSGKVQVAVGSFATTYIKNADIHLATIVYETESLSLNSVLDVEIVNMAGGKETIGDTDGNVIISSCTPTTCTAEGISCGSISDVCGGTIECGTCAAGTSCNAAGQCAANTCSDVTSQCCPDEGINCIGTGEYCLRKKCTTLLTDIGTR